MQSLLTAQASEPAITNTVRLTDHARSLIASGALPLCALGRVFGSHGRHHKCCLCGSRIERSLVQYELQSAGPSSLRFHQGCFQAWQNASLESAP
jgi:hypothetical protein